MIVGMPGQMGSSLLLLCLSFAALTACAGPSETRNAHQEELVLLADFDPKQRFSSSRIEPCGDPVDWKDVRVRWLEDPGAPGAAPAADVNGEMPRSGEWAAYAFSGLGHERKDIGHRDQ